MCGMDSPQTSRRAVLAGMCAIATVGLTNLIPLSPADAASAVTMGADGKAKVNLTYLKQVGAVVQIPQLNAALVKVSATKYAAYKLICPHAGAPVTAKGSAWTCYAHGSQFKPTTGAVVRGPAQSGLPKVPVKVAKGFATVG